MKGSALVRVLTRAARAALAAAFLTAVPGVAVASLPAHPAPTHDCCVSPEAMPLGTPCETAPCCIEKPAPRAPSVLTGGLSASPLPPAALPAETLAPTACALAETARSVPPRARSAPLFLLLATLLI